VSLEGLKNGLAGEFKEYLLKPIGLLTLTIQVKRVWRKGLKHKKGIPKADEQWVSNLIKRTTIKNGMSIFNVSCNLLKIP
jgi:hypothetical protein